MDLAYLDEEAKRNFEDKSIEFYRNNFIKDRDRILYSKEFRRLSGKTQVFVAGFDDQTRTRLTHTIEVAQIARTISSALNLNTDLTEAIALGHDVGHTPFGHVGERFLNMLTNGCLPDINISFGSFDNHRGFKHNLQSERVLSKLELFSSDYKGLNLTNQTLWGIVHHSGLKYKECPYFSKKDEDRESRCSFANCMTSCPNDGKRDVKYYSDKPEDMYWSFESFVVAVSDEISQRHHDIEDGIEAKIVRKDELIKKIEELFTSKLTQLDRVNLRDVKKFQYDSDKNELFIRHLRKFILNMYLTNVITNASNYFRIDLGDVNLSKQPQQEWLLAYCKKKKNDAFTKTKDPLPLDLIESIIGFDSSFKTADKYFQKYLVSIIVHSNIAQKMDGKAEYLLRKIVKAFVSNAQQMPTKTILTLFENMRTITETSRYKDINHVLEKICETQNVEKIQIKAVFENANELNARSLIKIVESSQIIEYKIALLRTISDYLAGMTDQYAIKLYESLYGFNSMVNS